MRGHQVRRGVLFGITLSAVSLTFAAVAWACTAAPYINVSPPAGAPGTRTTISGGGYSASPVEIKWVTAGSEQVVMSTRTNGPDFSVQMTTGANWAPGVYYVVASQGGQSSGRASYRVTSEAPVTASNSPSGTSETGGGSATSGGATAGSSSGSGDGDTYGIGTARGDAPATSGGSRTGDAAAAPGTQGGVADQAKGTASGQRPAAGRTTGAATGPAPATASAPSGPTSDPAGAPAASDALEPSPRSATSDLWGGFDAGLDGRSAPGLDTPAGSGDAGPDQAMVLGITLAGGFAALLGGFAVAEQQRRRRVTATTR